MAPHMRVPILTYHSANVHGHGYDSNDLVAFGEDLSLLLRLRYRVVPLATVLGALLGQEATELSNCVVLSCDDGVDLDYRDRVHPVYGPQRSLFQRLLDFCQQHGRDALGDGPLLHAFVIASPRARALMQQFCLGGQPWMQEDWWAAAQSSGLMSIHNHSWDHQHEVLRHDDPDAPPERYGHFRDIDDGVRAHAQVTRAQEYLAARLPDRAERFFAYPYGHVAPYLRDEWFPANGQRVGIAGALACGGEPVTRATSRWEMPRYVCGAHWKSPAELERLLNDLRQPRFSVA